ncbi:MULTISPECIES: hypothetical protein [unclassified Pseudomonas]|uniref:hypothetical protein n=1 Tax=unclassified Pseudomonas TaxID=196821 RepID=UPI002AC9C142|nr:MULTISPECIES: hypothetical protein [unclassified Pseudomonas]MEB0044837.1 hypothetical protein [Pseudomonas sp. Dout3]MEB0096196.1 hypothetical protein [Pseudomonas sp. DC1.2]WPX59401.1 hypothetical protein RHM68_01765 [Pseudomonas sp. DC1.2]
MTVSTADYIFLSIALINFGGMLIWIGVCLHLAYTRMDEMLERLKNCSAIMRRAPLRYAGPWGKLLLVGGISGIVTFPGIYLKHGGVSVEDLSNFPVSLKRKFAVLQWAAMVLLTIMFLLFFFGKYTRSIN